MSEERSDLGVVLSGGGARAAYQVGVLRAIGKRRPTLRFPIITGVSAGAINAAYIASSRTEPVDTMSSLADLWCSIRSEDIFDVRTLSLSTMLLRWGRRLLTGRAGAGSRARGFVDTEPLRAFLRRSLPHRDGEIQGIRENLEEGKLAAVALTALNYATGQTITWVQGRDIALWERPNRHSAKVRLGIEHVMASSALPLFFPAVRVGDAWYGDGGIRLAAPLSPALHLGASRLLAVSTRYVRTADETSADETLEYPAPGQIVGQLMKAIFLDLIDQDALRLERLNQLLLRLDEEDRLGLSPVDFTVIRPSVDLGKLAADYEADLPTTFRYLVRGLGSKETKSPDFLSVLMFEPGYLRRLIEIGEQDAEARLDELLDLVDGRGSMERSTDADDALSLAE
ncbi:MAG: patatin-like phospholipase family protein [Thermoanaerobaculia bacterium]|nr:patatin-like phospholipase family protein [Thermoanaerobaculia bacterium]